MITKFNTCVRLKQFNRSDKQATVKVECRQTLRKNAPNQVDMSSSTKKHSTGTETRNRPNAIQ